MEATEAMEVLIFDAYASSWAIASEDRIGGKPPGRLSSGSTESESD